MTETTSIALDEVQLQELRERVRGQVLTPADDAYLLACPIWNGMHDDRRPALLVRCSGAADVIAALEFAREQELRVAVRGGAHSVAGFSTCDGGIVVDLSPMSAVRVDPYARRVFVGGGGTWGQVDHETQAFGLATTGGLISTTGVAGFTLGGGIGWVMRKHGLACDNLAAADVVTADGRVLRASEDENADLLWGLRGGGGNFGIVTQFELSLHPVGSIVFAGARFWPADKDAELLDLFRDWAPTAPDDVTAMVNLTTAPPLPAIPEEWHGQKVVALIGMSVGPVDEGNDLLRDFRSLGEPIADVFGPMPYAMMQSLLDPLYPKGIKAYFKAANLARLDNELIRTLVPFHLEAPGPMCDIHVHQMGGAVGRVAEGDTAFGERGMPFVLNAVTAWHDAELADGHVEWARRLIAAAGPATTGRAYVNFLGDADDARVLYGGALYDRLRELKRRYDPDNVFRLNQNVGP